MMNHTRSGDRRSVSTVVSWIVLLAFLVTTVLPLHALAGDAVFYYHNDPTGSPVVITDAAGTKVWGADYEPFGEIAGLVETVPNNQQFLAKTVDPETSLHLLGARYYDGKLGRFLSVDPALLKGQPDSAVQYPQRLNLYTYVANNPYKHTDSTGRFLETAFDLVSFGLSLQGFKSDPSVMNGLALAYDTFALAVPLLPAGAGIIVKSAGGLEKAVDVGGAARGADNIVDATRGTAAPAKREVGSYTNTHESGKTYDGKGDRERSQESGRRIEKETGDRHIATEFTPAESPREAFKQESQRLDSHGGPKSDSNHNKIDSPGKKMRIQDGG